MSKRSLFKMILAVAELDREFAIFYIESAIKQADICPDENVSYYHELLALIEGN